MKRTSFYKTYLYDYFSHKFSHISSKFPSFFCFPLIKTVHFCFKKIFNIQCFFSWIVPYEPCFFSVLVLKHSVIVPPKLSSSGFLLYLHWIAPNSHVHGFRDSFWKFQRQIHISKNDWFGLYLTRITAKRILDKDNKLCCHYFIH